MDDEAFELAKEVDNWFATNKPTGWKDSHLNKGRRRYIEHYRHLQATRSWQDFLRQRLDLVSAGHEDDPMPACLTEVGYTGSDNTRIRQHMSHISAVPGMNL